MALSPQDFQSRVMMGLWADRLGDSDDGMLRRTRAADTDHITVAFERRPPRFRMYLWATVQNWKPCATSFDSIALGPISTEMHDVVVTLAGASTPYILQPAPDEGPDHYRLVGPCYIHGMMDGEAVVEALLDPECEATEVEDVFSEMHIV
ncbi:hypothetical protein LTR36_004790 [Oleoguttula mirabilis]|uniref:Uncharacterized protein n=1 Tax=Oleoguttula mirabilis TaxID=1507867 RepID=A0AAV9JFC2_9PEZI|nr:hypothetical protein LTR36_004790 [Oleoguttula mirabilis]